MALQKIDDIFLYTDLNWDPKEQSDSVEAKKWMDSLGIKYEHLNYADKREHDKNVHAPLRTWMFTRGRHSFGSFPFVIYTEVHDDLSPARYPRVLHFGLEEIISSNLAEIYKLGREPVPTKTAKPAKATKDPSA
jgi:hypothetical protein